MKQSLTNLAVWFSYILCLKEITADEQSITKARNQVRGFYDDGIQTQNYETIALVEATTPEKGDIGPLHFKKRDLPIRMGLAANPDVITQDVPPKERRSIKVVKRDLPIRMGLAANPDVITQDNVKLERRSPFMDEIRNVENIDKQLHSRSMHMGLAANPDVLTQDLPPSQSQKRRRTLEGLHPPSYTAPVLESRSLPRLFGTEETLEVLPQGSNPVLSSEQILASSSSVGRVTENEVNGNSRFQVGHNATAILPQVATQLPLLNLNTVGLGNSVTLPLYRREIPEEDKDLHPELRFQQHLNHALKRHAHFLDKSIDEELLQNNLRKRALSVGWQVEGSGVLRRSLKPRQAPTDSQSQGFPASAFAAAKTGKITPPIPVTAANSIGLHIEANDVGYFAEIQVGTPAATYRFIVDTGSSDAWLHLEDCRNFKDPTRPCNHPTLNPQSSTFKRTNNPFKITYGTGKVLGVLVEETMNMGGLILNNHVFGGVTRASDEFTGKNVPFDGLMGTAKSILSNQKVLTPIEALAKAGTLSGAFVGYALGRVSDSQNIGQVTFGGIDQTKFNGDLTIFPNVNKKGFWEGAMDVVQVGGKTILTDRTGILDTGTTLMVLPAEDAAVVHSNIPGATSDGKGGFRIPCTNTVKVGLSFGGVIFEINPVDLTFQPVGKNLAGQCLSGISVGTVGGPTQWLVGDVFLKNVYFATDVTNDQMGLAVLNPVPKK